MQQKFTGLKGFGLNIVERVPSHTAPNPENIRYLKTKQSRMGHLIGDMIDADDEMARLLMEEEEEAKAES